MPAASSPATKCPVCGKATAVGLVSGMLIQHDDKHGGRCDGSGQAPVVGATAATRSGSARSSKPAAASGSVAGAPASRATGGRSGAVSPAASTAKTPAKPRGVQVRRVEVDQDRLREREEKMARLREEREARARARNEFYTVDLEID